MRPGLKALRQERALAGGDEEDGWWGVVPRALIISPPRCLLGLSREKVKCSVSKVDWADWETLGCFGFKPNPSAPPHWSTSHSGIDQIILRY